MELFNSVFVEPFVLMADIPDLLLQTIWEGFVAGILYALIALGFVLIFKASGVFNFAQGIMVVFAALALCGHRTGRPAAICACLPSENSGVVRIFSVPSFTISDMSNNAPKSHDKISTPNR